MKILTALLIDIGWKDIRYVISKYAINSLIYGLKYNNKKTLFTF